jgi:hypothetical protein
MAKEDQEKPLNSEEHLMRLLGLNSLSELNRVLSEPPNEESLQEMGPPDELYELEWEDDLVDSAIWEIEQSEDNGTDAIFATRDGGMAQVRVSNRPPAEVTMIREFSSRPYRILPRPVELDRCNYLLVRFARRGCSGEFLLYEEI